MMEREKSWRSERETEREMGGGAVFLSAQCVKYIVCVHMLWDTVVSQASQVCTAVINFKTCLHFKKPQRTDLLMYSFLWKWGNAILVDPSTFPCNQGPQIPSVCIRRVSPWLRGPTQQTSPRKWTLGRFIMFPLFFLVGLFEWQVTITLHLIGPSLPKVGISPAKALGYYGVTSWLYLGPDICSERVGGLPGVTCPAVPSLGLQEMLLWLVEERSLVFTKPQK